MRLIDADELAHDLEHDVELCARALDDMNMVGKERDDMQFQKDCKQNCIWYISEQPTVEAIPIEWLRKHMITYYEVVNGDYYADEAMELNQYVSDLIEKWYAEGTDNG